MKKRWLAAGLLSIIIIIVSWAADLQSRDYLPEPLQGQAVPEQKPVPNEAVLPVPGEAPRETIPSQAQTPAKSVKPSEEKTKPLAKAKPECEPPGKSEVITPSHEQGAVKVTGSSGFTERVNKALSVLENKAPEYARKVTGYLKEIRESDHSGVIVQTGVFHLGRNTVTNNDTYWIASVIVHDAFHAELHSKGLDYAGEEAEAKCIEVQKAALKKMGASESYQSHLDQILNSNYWKVPFENRNW